MPLNCSRTLPNGHRIDASHVIDKLSTELGDIQDKLDDHRATYCDHSDKMQKHFRNAGISSNIGTKRDPFYRESSSWRFDEIDPDTIDDVKKTVEESMRHEKLDCCDSTLNQLERSKQRLGDELSDKLDSLKQKKKNTPPLWRPFKHYRHLNAIDDKETEIDDLKGLLSTLNNTLDQAVQEYAEKVTQKQEEIGHHAAAINRGRKRMASLRRREWRISGMIDDLTESDRAPDVLWLSEPLDQLSIDDLLDEWQSHDFRYHHRKEKRYQSILSHEDIWNDVFNGHSYDDLCDILADGMPFNLHLETSFDRNLKDSVPDRVSIKAKLYDKALVNSYNSRPMEVGECNLLLEEYDHTPALVVEHISTHPDIAGLGIGKKLTANILSLTDELEHHEIQFYAGEMGVKSQDAGPYFWAKIGCMIDPETKTAGGGFFSIYGKETFVGTDRISESIGWKVEHIIDSIIEPSDAVIDKIRSLPEQFEKDPQETLAKLSVDETPVINLDGKEIKLGKMVLSGDGYHTPIKFHGRIPMKEKPDWMERRHEELQNDHYIDITRLKKRRKELSQTDNYRYSTPNKNNPRNHGHGANGPSI